MSAIGNTGSMSFSGTVPAREPYSTYAQSLAPTERRLRWFIVGWLTVSTILNLINRNTLAILAPTLKDTLGMTQIHYGHIIMAFQVSYSVMYFAGGRFVDWVGEKAGMAACIIWWSIATMLHALSRGVLSLAWFRFLLGVGEPGNYPAALRTSARWFDRAERGLPIAIWSSGSSIGNLLSVPLIAFLALHWGWQMAFVVPGLLGLVWVAVWLAVYRSPSVPVPAQCSGGRPRLPGRTHPASGIAVSSRMPLPADSAAQRETSSESFRDLLRDPRLWAIVVARFLTDPIWMFYQAWTPKYLAETWNFDLSQMALYAWIPFLFGGFGGVFGGWASDWFIRRGLEPARARKRLLYITGAIAPLGIITGFVGSAGFSIGLIALMAFVCYVWFIVTAALMSDVFPEHLVGSVLGLAAGAGSFGGILMAWLAGHLLQTGHSYMPLFAVAGCGHLLAALVLLWFMKNDKAQL